MIAYRMRRKFMYERGIPAAPTMEIGMGMKSMWPWRVVTIARK